MGPTLFRLRDRHVLPLAMFFGTFSWSFVYISLPFHIHRISTWDEVTTLTWSGWILGIPNLVTVAAAPFWGGLAERRNPKRLYVMTQALQGIAFLGMAVARTLPELLVVRLVLGFIGASSTFAFVGAGRSADPVEVRRQVAAVQSAMTVGQVVGPLVGAVAAARLGFRESFVVGALILFGCGALVRWGLGDPGESGGRRAVATPARWREVLVVSLIVLGGSAQVFFLASILPQILPPLGVPDDRMLEIGGVLMFASGVAAALGSMLASRLADLLPERRLIPGLLALSSLFVLALAAVRSVWPFGALRFVQVACIAPVFPIVVARVAQSAGGRAIGVINSARIGAAFLGPVIATSLLAWTSMPVVYTALALMGLACVPLAAWSLAAGREGRV
ncbi:MAG TPA: MFS transporter [Methylomirabilota bacterium]|jgi:DHA1 family multidrug resistance protein-like MFS transporter